MSEDVTRRCDYRLRVGRKYEICGKPIEDDTPTVFGVDESAFKVDLCGGCKMRLREALDSFIKIASDEYTTLGPAVRKALRSFNGETFTVSDVREWHRKRGTKVSSTGMIRQSLVQEYKDAHGLN